MSETLVADYVSLLDSLTPAEITLSSAAFAPLSPGLVKCYFDGEQAVADIKVSEVVSSVDAEEVSDALKTLKAILDSYTASYRRNVNHPARLGLKSIPFPQGHVGEKGATLSEHVTGSTYYGGFRSMAGNSGANRFVDGEVPEELTGNTVGWFADGADVAAFGTYYLVPVGGLYPDTGYRVRPYQEMSWALCQVGIEAPAQIVEWNDEAGIRGLVDRVVNEDLETATAMRALQNTEQVSAGLREHTYRASLRAARTAFVGKTLRPRLVPGIVEEVLAAAQLTPFWSHGGDEAASGLNNLDDSSVFGWRNTKPVAGAYMITLRSEPGPYGNDGQLATRETATKFANDLQAALNPRRLGKVLTVSHNPYQFWIASDVDLFIEFRNAFKIPENSVIAPLNAA
jgi:hypothetical protein